LAKTKILHLSLLRFELGWERKATEAGLRSSLNIVETRIFWESDRSVGRLQFHELEKIAAMTAESSWEPDEIEFS